MRHQRLTLFNFVVRHFGKNMTSKLLLPWEKHSTSIHSKQRGWLIDVKVKPSLIPKVENFVKKGDPIKKAKLLYVSDFVDKNTNTCHYTCSLL